MMKVCIEAVKTFEFMLDKGEMYDIMPSKAYSNVLNTLEVQYEKVSYRTVDSDSDVNNCVCKWTEW